jgi:prevent-host-death family protein
MTMVIIVVMQTIQASKFKAKCLALMDQVARTGETILVTKNGRPVVEVKPHLGPRAPSLIGLHKGSLKIRGDIVAPIGSGAWKALR